MSEFRSCSRGEFFRRAKSKYPFLNDEALAKIIQREHVRVERPRGGYCVFTSDSWADLEQYIALRSRKAQQLRDLEGSMIFGGAQQ